MSLYWDIRCVDCGDWHGFEANRGELWLLKLVEHRSALEQLAPLDLALDVHMTAGGHYVRPGWFAEHKGHALKVTDEYERDSEGNP